MYVKMLGKLQRLRKHKDIIIQRMGVYGKVSQVAALGHHSRIFRSQLCDIFRLVGVLHLYAHSSEHLWRVLFFVR